jgi:hypothetical protein
VYIFIAKLKLSLRGAKANTAGFSGITQYTNVCLSLQKGYSSAAAQRAK